MEIEQVYREVAPKLQSYLTGNGCSYATACDYSQIERDCVAALAKISL